MRMHMILQVLQDFASKLLQIKFGEMERDKNLKKVKEI
jgi:hypothetical protein